MNHFGQYAPPPPDVTTWFQFALKWTPRAIVAGLAGYYCLGVAYDTGLMAKIDRIAMRILRPSLGYMGMAAFMPTFQWYSAWAVRVTAALAAGLLYDLIEKVSLAVYYTFTSDPNEKPLSPAPIHRPPSKLSPVPLHRPPTL
jgi:hypothetical protein